MAAVSETPKDSQSKVPPKPVLFTKSSAVALTKDRFVECKNDGNWYQVGVDHILNRGKKTKWSIKIIHSGQGTVMLGLASRGVIES